MSALQQLRELFQPDVEQMVEKRLEERLPSIIEALYPSMLEHVANNIHVIKSGSSLGNEVDVVSIQIHVAAGDVRYIGSPLHTINPHHYEGFKRSINEALRNNYNAAEAGFQTNEARISRLEKRINSEQKTDTTTKTEPT